jgi:choline dehydrogenase-like flavoprotein
MDRPNLIVLTHALLTKLTLEGKRATGVEIAVDGEIQRITAALEVVLSLGAMHTPKVLMLSGIGDQAELQRLGIPVVQHLPGVGQNFQDHEDRLAAPHIDAVRPSISNHAWRRPAPLVVMSTSFMKMSR